ncbi:MAG: transposase [Gammaproteobacteria bacterium]
MHYRRDNTLGGTWFFTVNLAERDKQLLVEEIDVLRAVMNKVKQRHPHKVDAMVVLPDHIHAIWTLPPGDKDFSTRWALIKSGFSRQLPKTERIKQSRKLKGERGIWQRRYWEHLIRDERDYEMHINYIHYNPVKHGYAKQAVDWPYSTIHQFIARGLVGANWGGCKGQGGDLSFGERQ